MNEASTRKRPMAEGGGPVRIKANALLIIPPRHSHGAAKVARTEGRARGKKNTGRTGGNARDR